MSKSGHEGDESVEASDQVPEMSSQNITNGLKDLSMKSPSQQPDEPSAGVHYASTPKATRINGEPRPGQSSPVLANSPKSSSRATTPDHSSTTASSTRDQPNREHAAKDASGRDGSRSETLAAPQPRNPMSRLQRMFSHQGKAEAKQEKEIRKQLQQQQHDPSQSQQHPAPHQQPGSQSMSRTSSRDEASAHEGDPRANVPRPPSSRASSVGHGESVASTAGGNAAKDKETQGARFVMHPDGTHSHHLRPTKRQEKLRNMLKDLLGGGRKKDEPKPADDQIPQQGPHGKDTHQLSLVQSWVDSMRNEKLASIKKDGPSATASLVEKYGKCHEIVGRGAFGIVRISHKADPKNSNSEQLYAVKEFRKRPSESQKKYTKRLTSEFCISSSLRHPNVIHTLDLLQDAKGDYCEVMEFCAGGDLYSLVLVSGKLDVIEADCYFKQLVRGVDYMHEMGVAHRDLKPENLLLTPNGGLKITDFGNGECFRMAWESQAHLTNGLCGSAPYIAPEEYTDKEFDPRAVDVWACGVIYMAMRTGRHLWRIAKKDEDEFYANYLAGRKAESGYEPIEVLQRARCRNVVYTILDPNPKRRITTKQILNSEWGREIRLCRAGELVLPWIEA